MHTQAGSIKANKKDIEAIKVFLDHAKMDMAWGENGSYAKPDSLDNELDRREFAKGQLGLENIEFMLRALCDKWPNN